MREWKVLPTDPKFLELTDEQIDFLLTGMNLDSEDEARARKGYDPNMSYDTEDDSFWNVSEEEFQPIKEWQDEGDIAQQVEDLLGVESTRKLRARFKTEQEYAEYLENGGAKAKEMYVDEKIQESLAKAYEEARMIEKFGKKSTKPETDISNQVKLDKNVIKEAQELFNSMDDDFEI